MCTHIHVTLRTIKCCCGSAFQNRDVLNVLGVDVDETVRNILMESLTADPENKEILLEVAAMLRDNGRLNDALVYADRAKEADPTESAVYVMKSELRATGAEHTILRVCELKE